MTPEERERARREIRKHYQLDGGWRQNPSPDAVDFFVRIGRLLGSVKELIAKTGIVTASRAFESDRPDACPHHDHGYAVRLCNCTRKYK